MEPIVILIIIFIIILIIMILQYFLNNNCLKLDNFSTTNKKEIEKTKVCVFLSKNCPHCINWEKNDESDVVTKLNKEGFIVEKIYPDNDHEKKFTTYNINAVPTAFLIHDGKSHKINGQISADNIITKFNQVK